MKTIFKNNRILNLLSLAICTIVLMSAMVSCDKDMEGKVFKVYDEYMLDEMMEEKGNMTMFLNLIDKAGYRGTVHAYGAYTLFAPNDKAIGEYLQTLGKASVNDLSKDEAEAIVKYHLIKDTLNTATFVDGRLASPNFSKKYLTSKATGVGENVVYKINRQADIVDKNLLCANT